jgi:hypothetical protein
MKSHFAACAVYRGYYVPRDAIELKRPAARELKLKAQPFTRYVRREDSFGSLAPDQFRPRTAVCPLCTQ